MAHLCKLDTDLSKATEPDTAVIGWWKVIMRKHLKREKHTLHKDAEISLWSYQCIITSVRMGE